MKALIKRLLNDFQRNFPLQPAPFEQIAETLNISTDQVLDELKLLQENGTVSRVGPVFRPNTVGVSTLAALSVPARQLEETAQLINSFPQVNHNYEREHAYNLWFVLTAESRQALLATLQEIETRTGFKALFLPLVKDYHIDLGFRMQLGSQAGSSESQYCLADAAGPDQCNLSRPSAEDLIDAVQDGLPLVARPYLEVARQLGWSEQQVIDELRDMIDSGTIKRLGIVVRHHELGYRANAMVVWDIPDAQVDRLGYQLGQQDCVTLCYQRPRRLPDWPYNLFCMVHGRDRDEVLACIDTMLEGLGLESVPHAVLFSGRRFKQRGARYRGLH